MLIFFYRAQSVENLGLAVVAILTGIIVDEEGYYMVELFFCFLLSGKLISRIISSILKISLFNLIVL